MKMPVVTLHMSFYKLGLVCCAILVCNATKMRWRRELNEGGGDISTQPSNTYYLNMEPAGEYVGYQLWRISRQKLLDILSGQDIRDITEVVVYFHDNGTLAENTEYNAQRFQVFKLNRHHNSMHSLHQISEFGINNFTFYQKRVRYTKNNSGTDHTKHWLQNSQSSHLYLSIRLRGEAENIRFQSSKQNPAMLVTIETRNPSPTTSRNGRSVNTDLSQIFSRNCEDTTGGGCCLEGRPTDLRQFLDSISDISDTPNERIVIRVCVGQCFPGGGDSLADQYRTRGCLQTGNSVTMPISLTVDGGLRILNIVLYKDRCVCAPR